MNTARNEVDRDRMTERTARTSPQCGGRTDFKSIVIVDSSRSRIARRLGATEYRFGLGAMNWWAALWGRVDATDSQVNQIVLRARLAVGDDGQVQQMIRTVPGFGYRPKT